MVDWEAMWQIARFGETVPQWFTANCLPGWARLFAAIISNPGANEKNSARKARSHGPFFVKTDNGSRYF